MNWGLWVIAGLVLTVAEVLLPAGFVILIIGLGFIFTGLFVLGGDSLSLPLSPEIQYGLAAILCLFFLIFARKFLVSCLKKNSSSSYQEFSQEKILLKEDINIGAIGTGEMRGTSWSVKNESSSILRAGESFFASEIQGLTVVIK